jgi:hypothetical protein
LGLALWDKAVFAWVLFGLAAGAVAAFPRELKRLLTLRNLGVAVPAMALGALPLIVYNIARPLETLRANAQVEQLAILGKSVILRSTIDGYVFFGFLTELDAPQPGGASHWYQAMSLAVNETLGEPRHSFTLWALGAAIVALPFLWRTRGGEPGNVDRDDPDGGRGRGGAARDPAVAASSAGHCGRRGSGARTGGHDRYVRVVRREPGGDQSLLFRPDPPRAHAALDRRHGQARPSSRRFPR